MDRPGSSGTNKRRAESEDSEMRENTKEDGTQDKEDPREFVYNLFFNLVHIITGKDKEIYDYNISQLEDLIVTLLGKLSKNILPLTIRWEPNRAVTIKVPGLEVSETQIMFPIRWYFPEKSVKLGIMEIQKSAILEFYKKIIEKFQFTTRRQLELNMTMFIVRSARRQDILYNKNIRFKYNNQSIELSSRYTPLFKGHQTFDRFKSLISNHTGVGTLFQILCNTNNNVYLGKAAKRVKSRLVNVDQQNVITSLSTGMGIGNLTELVVKTFLESCYIFMPRESNVFSIYPIIVCKGSRETFNNFFRLYHSEKGIKTCMAGSVPWWYVEFLVMTGSYTDQLGVVDYMVGKHYKRSDLDPNILSQYSIIPLNGNYLPPLKGSATSTRETGSQKNTVLSVHAKRTLMTEDYTWMDLSEYHQLKGTSDSLNSLRIAMSKRIEESKNGVPVCAYDEDEIRIDQTLGYWNN